jgi:hypothetical protein
MTANFSMNVLSLSSVACDIIAATSGGASSNPYLAAVNKINFINKNPLNSTNIT